MTNNIGNSESVMLKNLVKTNVILAMSLAVLLPLSALAAPMDAQEADDLSKEIKVESAGKVTTISNNDRCFVGNR